METLTQIIETSGSISVHESKVLYSSLSCDEKNISSLKKELLELKELVKNLQIKQLSKDLQLSEDVIANSSDIQKVRGTKNGRGFIPLLESQIREAQEHAVTAGGAAKYLKVNYVTYKKYAKLYGLWKTNMYYKAKHIINPEKGKYPLSKLLNCEFPDYPVFKLKDKLINSGMKKAHCEQCGYKERRITDNKLPLLLYFKDGNPRNHKIENLKLLCYNCTFCAGAGKGYIRKGKRYQVMDDPDRVQGSNTYIPNRF